ncbi:isocitrate lyase/phosphoenolpyruvate mutase family protein [Demequina sp. TMPB413]|nr:isocitrate lyase/phosphoenolpyruvate mutase family protein [Demequina sp. TMPB413]UPU88144.1 isocitrate lyase/phosphoenolpyruvate mutase family protein [Demequina sp. TMPB413]
MSSSSASSLLALHSGEPVLALVNVWDAESARLVENAGATAQATASFAVAGSRGFSDGENMPVDVAIAAVAEVCTATSLPVTADLEAGYGDARATVRRAVAAGAVGANIEDRMDPPDESVARMTDALQGAADEGLSWCSTPAQTPSWWTASTRRTGLLRPSSGGGPTWTRGRRACSFPRRRRR